MKKICVLGSINIDLVAQTPSFPEPGQTILGEQFHTFPGGKGANQAVAAGRLGADVTFLGKVGSDAFGDMALSALRDANVDTSFIQKEETSTGVAVITVNRQAENTIVYVPGANGLVDVLYVNRSKRAIDEADILMIQLEVPLETVEWAAAYATERGKMVILDPAPAAQLPQRLIKCSHIITPNETELQIISGRNVRSEAEAMQAAGVLLEQGAGMVVHKCGGRGAYLISPEEAELVPGFKVTAVDTTAAGDSFNAGLAVSLANGNSIRESIRFANAVGAISVTKMGAQSAMPTLEEVSQLINK